MKICIVLSLLTCFNGFVTASGPLGLNGKYTSDPTGCIRTSPGRLFVENYTGSEVIAYRDGNCISSPEKIATGKSATIPFAESVFVPN